LTARSLRPGVLLLACALTVMMAQAQPFVQEIAPFTVHRNDGQPYLNPFSGGLVQPRIGLVDADGDGLPDLFTLNPDNRLRYYRNEGNHRFRRIFPSPYEEAPVRSWFRLVDIDADGDLDLLSAGPLSEMFLYRNEGSSASPAFADLPDTLRYGDAKIFTQQETVPSLVDIDADGDLDLFSGNVEGSISFYRNVGTAAEPRFAFVTGRFENILVISSGGIPGRKEEESGRVMLRHGASVLDFVDLDRDGDLDMLFGDFFTDKLIHFRNTGTPQAPSFGMDRLDTAFLPTGDVVTSIGFNQPVSGDIDADGDIDVLVSSLYPLAPDQPIILYENTSGGSPGMPVMRRSTIDITNEIDAGSFSAPAFISDNERFGILLGSSDGSITYFHMTVNGMTVEWEQSGRFATQQNLFQAVPTAGDLDGDGEAEILVGDANDGRIRLFHLRNGRMEHSPWQLDTFRVNQYAAPALVDLDGDGRLDLFVGAGNGRFAFLRNIGTSTNPIFRQEMPPPPFDVLDIGQNSTITFHDLNGDDLPDAIVGGRPRPDLTTGIVRFYLNQGNEFVQSDLFPDIVTDRNPAPLAVRLPGAIYLFVGQQAGGLLAFRDLNGASSVTDAREDMASADITLLPAILSGSNRRVMLQGNIPEGPASLGVFDLLGREVFRTRMEETGGPRTFELPGLPPGTYQVTVQGRIAGRILILD